MVPVPAVLELILGALAVAVVVRRPRLPMKNSLQLQLYCMLPSLVQRVILVLGGEKVKGSSLVLLI